MGSRRAKSVQSERRASSGPSTHELVLELRRDLRELVSPRAPKLKTIAELAADWLPRKLKQLGSADSFGGRVRNHILPALGHHTAATLKKRDVEAFLQSIDLAPQTVNHIRDAGRQLVEDAIDNEDWPSSNPFAKAKSLEIPERDLDVLSRAEAKALLAAIPPRWLPLFATAIYLGPRRGSIFWVRPWEVDLDRDVITFSHTKTGKAIRGIPIPDELRPYLVDALRHASKEWLFVNRDGNRHSKHSKALRRVLRRALKNACIVRPNGETPALTFHGLRRVSSVLHQEAGCHPWVVSKVLGHSQASLALFGSVQENMTAKRYSPFSEDFIRKQLNLLSLK